MFDLSRIFDFTYFGDTYMHDYNTNTWKQVLTRGFPSYRAQSNMMVDEATGKMYIYGGSVLFVIDTNKTNTSCWQGTLPEFTCPKTFR
jgi:hypothetical protein